jgi:hypothetical protein
MLISRFFSGSNMPAVCLGRMVLLPCPVLFPALRIAYVRPVKWKCFFHKLGLRCNISRTMPDFVLSLP